MQEIIKTVFTDAKSTQELYFAASAEKYMGLPGKILLVFWDCLPLDMVFEFLVDHEKLATALAASLKKDDSASR